MKSKRQEKILELIAQYAIETQEELLERLSECGIPSTQATVSRDIKQLHLYKEPCGGGRYRYASSARSTVCDFNDRLQRILRECSLSVGKHLRQFSLKRFYLQVFYSILLVLR